MKEKMIRMIVVSVAFAAVCAGCQFETPTAKTGLSGKWVSDAFTLDFSGSKWILYDNQGYHLNKGTYSLANGSATLKTVQAYLPWTQGAGLSKDGWVTKEDLDSEENQALDFDTMFWEDTGLVTGDTMTITVRNAGERTFIKKK
jgi:hypothetical protein